MGEIVSTERQEQVWEKLRTARVMYTVEVIQAALATAMSEASKTARPRQPLAATD
jgi:hypothetical protein